MSLRAFLTYATIGALLGIALIVTHIVPDPHASHSENTPAYRNSQRLSYVNDLANGIREYHKDHGSLPVVIATAPSQICTSTGTNCQSMKLIDLSFLTTAGDYIMGIPHDPKGGRGLWGSGFYIRTAATGDLIITAPEAELGKTISASVSL